MSFENNDDRIDRLEQSMKDLLPILKDVSGALNCLRRLNLNQSDWLLFLTNGQTAILKCLAVMPGVPEEQKQSHLKVLAQYETMCERLEKQIADLKAGINPPMDGAGNLPPAPPGS